MKKTAFLLLIMIIFALALFACSQPLTSSRNLSAAALSMQIPTPTPPVEDKSEIGSTTGIFVMGIVIVAITSLPILMRKKK